VGLNSNLIHQLLPNADEVTLLEANMEIIRTITEYLFHAGERGWSRNKRRGIW
jgi:hypothetical protein